MNNIPQDGEKPQSSFPTVYDIAERFSRSFDRIERDALWDELHALSAYLRKMFPVRTEIGEVDGGLSALPNGPRHIVIASDCSLILSEGRRKKGDALCRRLSRSFSPRVFAHETREASCVHCLMIAERVVNAIEAVASDAESEAAE